MTNPCAEVRTCAWCGASTTAGIVATRTIMISYWTGMKHEGTSRNHEELHFCTTQHRLNYFLEP